MWVLSSTMGMEVDAVNVNSAGSESIRGPARRGVLTCHGRRHRCSHSCVGKYSKCCDKSQHFEYFPKSRSALHDADVVDTT